MKKRVIELDILRGLSIFGMILVITPGDWSHRFQWTDHAAWRGYPLSDMIFPSFLFCIGMSMAISFHKRKLHNSSSFGPYWMIAKRVVLLIIIGILVNGFPYYELSDIRIPGILQRIALCYFVASCIWIFIEAQEPQKPVMWLSVFAISLLVAYYLLLYYIPVPGLGITGDNSVTSWPVVIDQKIFGVDHLWQYGTTDGQVTYDPDGVLASFPASFNVLLGLIIGVIYLQNQDQYTHTLLFGLGLVLIIVGFSLDYFHIMPSIKKIWTSSFALLSGGFSVLVLAVLKLLLQFLPKIRWWLYPFMIFGANAILAFVISNALMPVFDIPVNDSSIRKIGFDFFNLFISNAIWSSFAFSITFLMLLFLILNVLYKKRVFIRV